MINHNYDFILCDLDMPVMNGYECAEKIRQHYSNHQSFFSLDDKINNQSPLLIACSALINPKVEEKAKDHGFDFCVQSPLTIQIIED